MRISVECGGFTQAADACMAGNQVAAMLTETLSRRLGGYAGMAGNDATSTDFATSYDASSREALATLAELTHAFIGVGRLIALTGANHRDAETASAGLSVTAYDGRWLDDDSFVRVSPVPPPSSLGHQEPSLGQVDRWILDHVEGFLWPDADVDRLREAAATWKNAAASVADLTDHLTIATSLLADQHSPEIPLAIGALDRLKDLIRDTAAQLIAVATACEEYADAVEEVHNRTRALLAEIAQMIVEGAAISAVATALTSGLGGGAAAGAAISRITAQTPRFHALLTTLRVTATASAARLRTARRQLDDLHQRIEKYARVPLRTDRGSMKNPLAWGGHARRTAPRVQDPKLRNYVTMKRPRFDAAPV